MQQLKHKGHTIVGPFVLYTTNLEEPVIDSTHLYFDWTVFGTFDNLEEAVSKAKELAHNSKESNGAELWGGESLLLYSKNFSESGYLIDGSESFMGENDILGKPYRTSHRAWEDDENSCDCDSDDS
jgi:hypothetical protein